MAGRSELHLAIEGMHCDACVNRVTAALRKLPGVEVREVKVGSAEVGYDPGATSADLISSAVDRIGFTAKVAGK